MAPPTETVMLEDGTLMPTLILGTGKEWADSSSQTLLRALQLGIRHVNAGTSVHTQTAIGHALLEWGGKREEVFITIKYDCTSDKDEDKVREAVVKALQALRVTQVDLYIVDFPENSSKTVIADLWRHMEVLRMEGLCKLIGVANMSAREIDRLSHSWQVKPAVNQMEFHPYCAHEYYTISALEQCQKHGIIPVAYCVLASIQHRRRGPVDEVVRRVAASKGLTEVQVLILWARQNTGGPVMSITDNPDRMQELVGAFTQDENGVLPKLDDGELHEIGQAGTRIEFRVYHNRASRIT